LLMFTRSFSSGRLSRNRLVLFTNKMPNKS
jgi:hypothetical protein